jgi:hypothetical protein
MLREKFRDLNMQNVSRHKYESGMCVFMRKCRTFEISSRECDACIANV